MDIPLFDPQHPLHNNIARANEEYESALYRRKERAKLKILAAERDARVAKKEASIIKKTQRKIEDSTYKGKKKKRPKNNSYLFGSVAVWQMGVLKVQCHYCETWVKITNITKDHVIPISKGGPDHIKNLVPCCKRCNTKKGSMDYDVFIKIAIRDRSF